VNKAAAALLALLILSACAGRKSNIKYDVITKGKLSSLLVMSAIGKHSNDINECYEEALKSEPNPEGSFVMTWIITENGKTDSIRIKESSLKNDYIPECLKEKMKKWSFYTSTTHTEVEHKFRIAPPLREGDIKE